MAIAAANGSTANIVVLFVDIRGFTEWAERVDNFIYLHEFGRDFHALIAREFKDSTVKFLGDGAMVVRETTDPATAGRLRTIIKSLLGRITRVEGRFKDLCETYATRYGSRVRLSLAWAVAKGSAKRVDDNEYVGPDINKASRLCSIARPYGVIIERDDFPHLPNIPGSPLRFLPQVRKLVGIRDDVNVWATIEIATQFISRETLRESPEVHVAGLCFRRQRRVPQALLAKRSPERSLFPGLYEGCGGQLRRNETFTDGVKRHYKLELNLDVGVQEQTHEFYLINVPGEVLIPGIKFMCQYEKGDPRLINHTEVRWVDKDELAAIPEEQFTPGTKGLFLNFMNAM